MPFEFRVIDKCYQNASGYSGRDADFYLEEDGWNDFQYHVMYHLHATKRLTGDENVYLGYLRIMKSGQEKGDIYLLRRVLGDNAFTELPEGFVSLTFAMSVYKGLNRYIEDPEERKGVAEQLHMILDEVSPFYKMVEDEECFQNAMLRDSTMNNYSLQKAQSLLLSKECLYDLRKESFKFKLNNADEPTVFDFTCLTDDVFTWEHDKAMIPNGCVVFIGGNGSGKSTAMYKLAKLMYADTDERRKKEYQEYIGTLIPNNVGISKLIVVSYSPFDNFLLPAWNENEEESGDRFVYCGIRNNLKERDLVQEEQDGKMDESDEVILSERQNRTLLKNISELSDEFIEQFGILQKDSKKSNLWDEIAEEAQELHPELSRELSLMASIQTDEDRLWRSFKELSTGNKYIFHMLATVIASIEEDSLLLFDEPENHVHPPLLSFLLGVLRLVLYKYHSVMFISTHSPVIVQETFANNVYIIRRVEGKVKVKHPEIETYGANIGEVTTEVFNLTSEDISYYRLFEKLYRNWDMDDYDTPEKMLTHFANLLGHGISEQLTAYLIDLWCEDHHEKEDDHVDN